MSMGFTRAHVDRASLETRDGPIRFVAASEGRKSDGINLRMAGAQLERYLANPVVLYGHRHQSRGDLPIGRAAGVTVDGKRLLIDVEFDREDPFAAEVERKYRAGFMNAVSIGFSVSRWEDSKSNYWTGGVAVEWMLNEMSCVPVPTDAQALVESGRAAAPIYAAAAEALSRSLDVPVRVTGDEAMRVYSVDVAYEVLTSSDPMLLGHNIARAIQQTVAELNLARATELAQPRPFEGFAVTPPATEEPARAALDPDAVRALLAAFTPKEGTNDE